MVYKGALGGGLCGAAGGVVGYGRGCVVGCAVGSGSVCVVGYGVGRVVTFCVAGCVVGGAAGCLCKKFFLAGSKAIAPERIRARIFSDCYFKYSLGKLVERQC